MANKVAVVLGGTYPHIELINKLKKRGYDTVLFDYLKNPPAKQAADKHIQISTLDKEEVLKAAKALNAGLVISSCIDQANMVACYVSEQLNLPRPYSYQTALDVTNKKRMKEIFVRAGIPTAEYYVISSVCELEPDKLQFPLVIKPVDSNSSKCVKRAEDTDELYRYAEEALSQSRDKAAIVEEFQEGTEVQVDCFVDGIGKTQVLLTRDKRKQRDFEGQVLNSLGSIFPSQVLDSLEQSIQRTAEKIADAFELKNVPFFFQAIVNEKDIKVLEFAPRIGGGMSSYMIKTYTDFDILEASINSWNNCNVDVRMTKNKYLFSTTLLYGCQGRFQSVEGLEALKESGEIMESVLYKRAGDVLTGEMDSGSRIAAFVSRAENLEQLKQKNERILDRIRITDESGTDILKRKLYT